MTVLDRPTVWKSHSRGTPVDRCQTIRYGYRSLRYTLLCSRKLYTKRYRGIGDDTERCAPAIVAGYVHYPLGILGGTPLP